jgi:glutathione S-transferase
VSDEQRDIWYAHWIHEVFRAAELTASGHAGPFVFGEQVTLADTCLVPQIYNARRFKVPLDDYPQLVAVDAYCNSLPEFEAAIPENQPDAT